MTETTPKIRDFPPAPRDFDPLTASRTDLLRHGLPQRPAEPGAAALWDERARRYRGFEHIRPELVPAERAAEVVAAGLQLSTVESCGYELLFAAAPITIASGRWTVPNLAYNPAPSGLSNLFHTFFGLGFLDVHVEMSVDAGQNVTSSLSTHVGAVANFPVRPGDTISATLCLQTDTAGTAAYFLANETTGQATNFSVPTGFPPAHRINAGVSRGNHFNGPPEPLARFGLVYFDDLNAFATSGQPRLLDGTPTSMTELNGTVLAQPERLTDFTFKAVHA